MGRPAGPCRAQPALRVPVHNNVRRSMICANDCAPTTFPHYVPPFLLRPATALAHGVDAAHELLGAS